MLWPWHTGSKVPIFMQKKSFTDATTETFFFLEQADGRFTLKEEHAYYYQVQAQIRICSVNYCDFVVW